MTKEEICTRVRAAVDSLVQSRTDGVTLVTDQRNLDAVIEDKIPYAMLWVCQNADSDKLDELAEELSVSSLGEADIIRKGKVWHLRLPEGTLRVLSARLSTWMYEPIPADSASKEAMMQTDEYARGSWDRPVTVIRRRSGRLWLEFYSGRGTETKEDIEVSYIPTPLHEDAASPSESADITIPQKTEGAFIYYVAALTMTAFREDISSSLFQIAAEQLGISNTEQQ